MKRRTGAIANSRRLTQTPYNLLGALSAGLLVVLFCLILLWHNPLLFWNDDYEVSVLPVFADMARSWSEGHWPILSPYSWVCGNFAGEFQYGTFSLFVNAAVVLIWKFPLAFPQQAAALSIAHLFVLAIGAFLLARDRGFSVALSIFVALIASLSGWIICWGATDWFGALGAFTWLPWAWWGAERALDSRRTKWRLLWPAPFVYLLVTGGFPYTVLMLLLLIAWLSVKTMWERPQGRDGRDTKVPPTFAVLPMLFGVALGFGLSAPAWLALLDLVQGSARELQSAAAHWQWRVPPTALPGLVLPSWTVNWTDFSSRGRPHAAAELACGLVAPAALVAALIWRPRLVVRQIKWELVLLLLVLLLCMTPTAGMFRWSFRWLPFFHLVLAICAAEALRLKPGSPTPATAALGLVVLIGVAALIFHTSWLLRFAAHLDSDWTRCGLVVFRVPAARFRISLLGTRRDHVLRVARHVSLRSDELWSSALQFFSRTRSNLRRSIRSGFISVCIHGPSLPIVQQTNPNRSAKRYGREARRCGPDCDSSMATARSAPQVSRANLKQAFMVKLIPMSEAIY